LREDVVKSVRELEETDNALEAYALQIKETTKKLQDIDSKLELLQNQPESERNPNFDQEILSLKEQRQSYENDIAKLREQETEAVEKYNQMQLDEDKRLARIIEDYNKKYQQEDALTDESKIQDLANQFWETAKGYTKGYLLGEDSLRYRYQGHAVFLSAHSKMYYYLDENSNRVLVPLEEQKRFRKLDEEDVYSQTVGELQTWGARRINDVKNVYGEAKETIENAASTAADTASNIADEISNAASSLYDEALSIFAPTEDTAPVTDKFEKAAGTTAAAQQPAAAPNAGPSGP